MKDAISRDDGDGEPRRGLHARLPGASGPRVRVFCLLASAMLVLFFAERLAFLAFLSERFEGIAAREAVRGFAVGLRFDAVACAMLLVPLVPLGVTPSRLLARRWFRRLVSFYCALALTTLLVLAVAGFFFFREYGERLNHKAIVYLQYDYVWKVLWTDFALGPALLLAVAAVPALAWCVSRLCFAGPFRDARVRPSRAAHPAAPPGAVPVPSPSRTVPPLSPVRGIVSTILLGAVLALALRGGVGPKALNTGPAWFTGHQALAQLTLNGVFTLREAIFSLVVREKSLRDCFELLPDEEASALTVELVAGPGDTLCDDAANPLRRVTDTGRPRRDWNVVLIVLESLSWHYIGAMGGEKGLTPHLDALVEEGVLMDRCFAVGNRTTRGFCGLVAGHPDLPGRSVTTRSRSEGTFLTLGRVLKSRGYDTMFIYAGQGHYDHRQSFLGSNGFDRFVFSDRFESRTFRTHLGYCDGDLFDQAHREFVAAGTKPFFATLLTLSFHRSYEVPPGTIEPTDPSVAHHEQIDCIRYVDGEIGRFFEKARGEEYFDRTLFVVVADHMGGYLEHPNTAAGFRVPFLVLAPSIVAPRRVGTLCSQTDVPPTILSLLGGTYEHCFFGSSVLDRPAGAGRALIQADSQLMMISAGADVVVIPHGASPRLRKYVPPGGVEDVPLVTPELRSRCARLAREAIGILQTAEKVTGSDRYNLDHSRR